jgi:branched-chain amino acid transport system permease protein
MKKQARKQTTKSGNILGILAAITVLLFGGWSGALVGWLVGVGAGVMACQGSGFLSLKSAHV